MYAGQEATLEWDMEWQTGSRLGKEYAKAVYCHPAYLNYMQNTSCEMLGWMKIKLESTLLLEEISITSDMKICRDHPNGRNLRGVREPPDEGESEKAGLKCNIQKTKIMASSPITS